MVTIVSTSQRFDIFSSVSTICDMATEYTINASLSYLWLKHFAINSSWWIIFSVMLFEDYFWPVSSCKNTFIRDFYFLITEFLFIIYFVIFDPWFSLLTFIMSVFIDIYDFFVLVKFCYILAPYLFQKYFVLSPYFPQSMQVPLHWDYM